MPEEETESIELGGNITLTGFRNLDKAQLVVVKKIVGNYAKKMSETAKKFENLSVTLKKIHGDGDKYELHAKLMDNGKAFTSEVTDFNLFFALDKVLKKILNSID